MVASSLAEAITEKRGWNITRVMGALWPVRVYRSGGLGIHSEGDLRSDLPPAPPALPLRSSASASAILDSSSMTFFCRRITEIHFFSSRPLYFFSTSPSCKNCRMVSGRCGWRDWMQGQSEITGLWNMFIDYQYVEKKCKLNRSTLFFKLFPINTQTKINIF